MSQTNYDKQVKRRADESKSTQAMLLQQSVMHIGPIPSPEVLEGYDKVCPGAAERILSMAEREQEIAIKERENNILVRDKLCEHKIVMDTKTNEVVAQALQQKISLSNLGQRNALIISSLMLVVIVILGFYGYEKAIMCLSLVMGTGVVTTFINGRKEKYSTDEDLSKHIEKATSEGLVDKEKSE